MNKFQPLDFSKLRSNSIEGFLLKGQLLSDKLFTLADAGIDRKVFSSWKSKGLADFIEKNKWTKLSFIDLLWVQTLKSLYNFGCSFELMKKIYDYFFTRAFEENLSAKNIKSKYAYYKNISEERSLTKEEEEILVQLELFNNDPKLLEVLRYEINYFYTLVLECLQHQSVSGIIIYEDESFEAFALTQEEIARGLSTPLLNRNHIFISITSFIEDFITDEEKTGFLVPCGLMDEDEMRIVREMRNKNIRSLTITFSEKDHSIEKIESDQFGVISGEKAKEIMRILGMKNYSGLELNTRDGKTLAFKRTEKKYY